MIPANWDRLTELDQILVPTSAGYRAYNILALMSGGRRVMESTRGFGLAPLHFIDQRGPYQDGSTPLDMRWDNRTIQIAINEFFANRTGYFDRRWWLVDLLRPNRSFGIFISPTGYSYPTAPLIYRKWLPGGKVERGTDAVTAAGSNEVTSLRGKFVHNGLRVGMAFEITSGADIGVYHVTEVENDYTVILDTNMAATATNIHWRYVRGNSFRDLYCLLEQGPSFDEGGREYAPAGYTEALRFVAHDPFWYGEEQSDAWVTPTGQVDLIFDYGTGPALVDSGAWFGTGTIGFGRWMFAEDFVGDTIDMIYWGHEVAYPTIEIDGPATNPQIANLTTGIALTLDYSIVLNQTIVIDTLDLTAVDNFGNDIYPYLSGDIASFALAPEPQAPNRINQISASYVDGTSDSAVRIKWKNKYVSL
jgi:hypothetical protein